ncbi:peptidase domain-containing ABC transporter [Pantoea agglomerans]|uniref:peptidase domain-containing ABC transporter n=1 Tax=Enterobacter agglomerans TaxID=549 RepID=UPI00320AD2E8
MHKTSIKHILNKLDLRLNTRIQLIHQTESSECGLACLAMVCSYYGMKTDLTTLRQQFNLSSRGTTLSGLTNSAELLGMSTRALSLDIDEIGALKLPCILHWEFNHFVVLVSVKSKRVILHDPASGRRNISLNEFSQSFTGVALEVYPGTTFQAKPSKNKLSLGMLAQSVYGLKRSLGKIFMISLVIESINLIMPIGTQLVMDHAIPAGDMGLLSLVCIGMMFFILLRTAVSTFRSWSSLVLSTLISVQWQSGLISHLLKLPLNYFERRKLGDIQSRFDSVHKIQDIFTGSIIGAIMDVIMVFGVGIMMILYGGWLTWYVWGFTTIYVLIRFLTYGTYRQLSEETLVRDARKQSHFMETLYGIATVKIQGLSERRSAQWLNLEIDNINSGIRVTKMDLLFGGLNSFIAATDQIVILWLGTGLVIDNKMTIGMFIAFSAFRDQFAARMSSLTNFILKLRMISLHNERISDIALYPQSSRKADIYLEPKIPPLDLETFNLSYRYDSQSKPVFSGLNIKISAGESVAIIGQSGAGKTTLMKVLCGLFEPDEGKVLVNGADIQNIGINNFQKMIGCVLQDDKLFSGSIRDNICGFVDEMDDEWMYKCAKASYIHDVISEMPMGYETMIGELGEGLSGGQKQRIFIARALYRSPGIIFMDEATSSLDSDSEIFINQAIKELKITRVIIAHRESTIASADRTIELN